MTFTPSFIALRGFAPEPPEFNALGKKMKMLLTHRRNRQSFTPACASFLCPAQALGFALQRHPILLTGRGIVRRIFSRKHSERKKFQKSSCISIIQHTINSLMSLSFSPTRGDHLRYLKFMSKKFVSNTRNGFAFKKSAVSG